MMVACEPGVSFPVHLGTLKVPKIITNAFTVGATVPKVSPAVTDFNCLDKLALFSFVVCKSSIVSNIQSAQSLKGCTIINGSLEIFISSGGGK